MSITVFGDILLTAQWSGRGRRCWFGLFANSFCSSQIPERLLLLLHFCFIPFEPHLLPNLARSASSHSRTGAWLKSLLFSTNVDDGGTISSFPRLIRYFTIANASLFVTHTCPRSEHLCPSSKLIKSCGLISILSGGIKIFKI